ncbi:uncharacterized protein FOMMEDRAFT_22245 [Fomitiporia mediterranea MF3/22]|uniref:uncharacterized protein n=1 Tax=Fomitiporia mediterranea (strain MF3/22) TaxID=694068 RepID=UPI0004408E5B|nr:uncharacterized protein FOMMEDRAFT_22245 [Fomitiporia mediterranea MF3/22]EJD00447.1 hypothetical protein FOMMEDRAFT_22245 [Fomitiporia mediterranea MF3/22]
MMPVKQSRLKPPSLRPRNLLAPACPSFSRGTSRVPAQFTKGRRTVQAGGSCQGGAVAPGGK